MLSRLDRALAEGVVTNHGPYVQDLEAVLTKYLRQPTIVFSSGYSALVTMLMAADVKDREVILPSFTFPATPSAVIQAGGIPIYADIKPETLTLDWQDVERKITPNTVAIVPVDAYGISAVDPNLTMVAVNNDVKLLFDSAPSFGTNYLTEPASIFSTAAIYSFHATKQMAVGEGGCLTSRHEELIHRARQIRNFGLDKQTWVRPGINGKMTEISALIGLENMKTYPERVLRRRAVKALQDNSLSGAVGVTTIPGPHNQLVSWCYNPILIDRGAPVSRDGVVNLLNDRGIQTRKYYTACSAGLPVTADVASRVIALPCYESMTGDELDRIEEAFADIMGRKN